MGQREEWQDTGDIKEEKVKNREGSFILGRGKEVNTRGEGENNNKDV